MAVYESVACILIGFLVGLLVGFLLACYFRNRRYESEEDDLGYLENIIFEEEGIKNEMCT